MRSLLSRFLFRLSALALMCCIAALAQFETAEVLGTIRDASGAGVPNAKVKLHNQDTGIENEGATDGGGNYDFVDVKPGRYSVNAEAPGFSLVSATDVKVDVNARQRVDLALQPGAVNQSIEVT